MPSQWPSRRETGGTDEPAQRPRRAAGIATDLRHDEDTLPATPLDKMTYGRLIRPTPKFGSPLRERASLACRLHICSHMKTFAMKHYMTPTPHSVGDEMPLKTASELMRRYDIRHLPVQHAGRLVGIVSERDIAVAASVHPSAVDLKVGEVMYPQPYAVSADEPLDEALFQMVRNKYGSVVVTNDKGRAVGIFTMTDAARYLAQSVDERRRGATPGLSTASDGRPSGERAGSIAEVMTHSPHCVSKGTTLGKARILMRKKGVRHLPITDEKGHVVGIISERDLEFAALYPDFLSLPVDRFLVAPPYVVNKEAPLDEVIEEMIRQKYGCTIVIDAERVPIGIFTSIDALELLHRLVTTGSAAPPPEKEPTAAPAA